MWCFAANCCVFIAVTSLMLCFRCTGILVKSLLCKVKIYLSCTSLCRLSCSVISNKRHLHGCYTTVLYGSQHCIFLMKPTWSWRIFCGMAVYIQPLVHTLLICRVGLVRRLLPDNLSSWIQWPIISVSASHPVRSSLLYGTHLSELFSCEFVVCLYSTVWYAILVCFSSFIFLVFCTAVFYA